jgi:DeoR family fructose operon transcriptional repressor
MNIIHSKSFVTIKELMDELDVSKSTINRDLIELEKRGMVKRERGGATAVEISKTLSTFNEMPVVDKENLSADAKRIICEKAVENVKDGDCIYIDGGSTPAYLIQGLLRKRVKIVTASTYLLRKIPSSFQEEVYLLGGEFHFGYDMSVGTMACDMLHSFNFDHGFFSTNGINLDTGEVYVFDVKVGAVKLEAMKRCNRNYLLVDDSKFNVKALCTWTELSAFTNVYVNMFSKERKLPDNFIICS